MKYTHSDLAFELSRLYGLTDVGSNGYREISQAGKALVLGLKMCGVAENQSSKDMNFRIKSNIDRFRMGFELGIHRFIDSISVNYTEKSRHKKEQETREKKREKYKTSEKNKLLVKSTFNSTFRDLRRKANDNDKPKRSQYEEKRFKGC